jgi:hypothetical protein
LNPLQHFLDSVAGWLRHLLEPPPADAAINLKLPTEGDSSYSDVIAGAPPGMGLTAAGVSSTSSPGDQFSVSNRAWIDSVETDVRWSNVVTSGWTAYLPLVIREKEQPP